MARCQAKTKSGAQCKNAAVDGTEYCHLKAHGDKDSFQNVTSEELSTQQRRFVEEFCACFNASEAARRAGYAKSRARQTGYDNLQHPAIAKAINDRLDRLSLSAEEATARLTEMARADLRPFLQVNELGEAVIDLSTDEAQAALHTIKKLKQEEEHTEEGALVRKTEIELHDAKDAIWKLLNAYGKIISKLDHTSDGEKLEAPQIVLNYPNKARKRSDD